MWELYTPDHLYVFFKGTSLKLKVSYFFVYHATSARILTALFRFFLHFAVHV